MQNYVRTSEYPYLNSADSWGHNLGPKSEEIKLKLLDFDKFIKSSVSELMKLDHLTQFMFLGDHGMTEVKQEIDVGSIIVELGKALKLTVEKDYIYFLDSTLLRAWFFTENAENRLKPLISTNKILLENGSILNSEIAEKYSIPIGDRRYGDIAWWANEGCLIFPDFFHNKIPYKGMHGYTPNVLSAHGTCIVWGKGVQPSFSEELNLFQVYHIIGDLLQSK